MRNSVFSILTFSFLSNVLFLFFFYQFLEINQKLHIVWYEQGVISYPFLGLTFLQFSCFLMEIEVFETLGTLKNFLLVAIMAEFGT